MASDIVNKLCKWRSIFAGWIAGSSAISSPGTKGLRDLMDKQIIYRVELSALASLLIKKGVFTAKEFTRQIDIEAAELDKVYERLFPGMRSLLNGIEVYDADMAEKTMKDLNFPP